MESDNPYRPPAAAVADVPDAGLLVRPVGVRRSVQLLWFTMALGFVLALIDVLKVGREGPEFWLGLGVAGGAVVVIFAIFFWIYGAVYAGRNWARIVVLVLTIVWTIMLLAVVVMLRRMPDVPAATTSELLFNSAQFAMTLVATVLLFTPAANAWYRDIKARG
jgi:hypothetical protein